jgi:hypothetical protein
MVKVIVKDIVSGTLSNIEGTTLYCAIDSALKNNDSIYLSFEGINTISSSFLNSSIGTLVDAYGIDIIKDRIKIVNYTKPLANVIVKYVSDLKKYTSA